MYAPEKGHPLALKERGIYFDKGEVLNQCAVFEMRIRREWSALNTKTKTKQAGNLNEQKLHSLTSALRSLYEKIIREDSALAVEQGILSRLWRLCFYKQLDHVLKILHMFQKRKGRSLKAKISAAKMKELYVHHYMFFKQKIDSASKYFHRMVHHQLRIAGVVLNEDGEFIDQLTNDDSQTTMEKKSESESMTIALRLAHQFLIYLGDLQRYLQTTVTPDTMKLKPMLTNGSPTEFSARTIYKQAQALVSSEGNSHNQLAVLANIEGDTLCAAYQYFRALGVRGTPSASAMKNVQLLFKVNEQRLVMKALGDKLKKGSSKPPAGEVFEDVLNYIGAVTTLDDLKRCITWVLGIHFNGGAMGGLSRDELKNTVDALLEKIREVVIDPLIYLDQESSEGRGAADALTGIIYQLTLSSIFCVHHALAQEEKPSKDAEFEPDASKGEEDTRSSTQSSCSEDNSVVEAAMYLTLSLFNLLMNVILPEEHEGDESRCFACRVHLLKMVSINASWLFAHPHFLIHPCGLSWRRPRHGKRLSTQLGDDGFDLRNNVFCSLAKVLNYLRKCDDVNTDLTKPAELASLLPEQKDVMGFLYIGCPDGLRDPTTNFQERRANNPTTRRKIQLLKRRGETCWKPDTKEMQLLRYCNIYNFVRVIAQKYEVMRECTDGVWVSNGLQSQSMMELTPELAKPTATSDTEVREDSGSIGALSSYDVKAKRVADVVQSISKEGFQAANSALRCRSIANTAECEIEECSDPEIDEPGDSPHGLTPAPSRIVVGSLKLTPTILPLARSRIMSRSISIRCHPELGIDPIADDVDGEPPANLSIREILKLKPNADKTIIASAMEMQRRSPDQVQIDIIAANPPEPRPPDPTPPLSAHLGPVQLQTDDLHPCFGFPPHDASPWIDMRNAGPHVPGFQELERPPAQGRPPGQGCPSTRDMSGIRPNRPSQQRRPPQTHRCLSDPHVRIPGPGPPRSDQPQVPKPIPQGPGPPIPIAAPGNFGHQPRLYQGIRVSSRCAIQSPTPVQNQAPWRIPQNQFVPHIRGATDRPSFKDRRSTWPKTISRTKEGHPPDPGGPRKSSIQCSNAPATRHQKRQPIQPMQHQGDMRAGNHQPEAWNGPNMSGAIMHQRWPNSNAMLQNRERFGGPPGRVHYPHGIVPPPRSRIDRPRPPVPRPPGLPPGPAGPSVQPSNENDKHNLLGRFNPFYG